MDLSGIIFVVLALAWAMYLIPKALKHHDEVARTRSIDRFSTAMRVLARREPVSRRDARLVVTPPRPRPASDSSAPARVKRGRRPQNSRGLAARRRRRVLGFFLLCTLATVGAAAVALIPWWSVAVPGTIAVLFLFVCRRQVRRANESYWERARADSSASLDPAPRRAVRVEAPYGTPRSAVNERGFEEVSPIAHEVEQTETVVVSVPTVDGGSLWDPLPVTLPTYVTKRRATRTVRTIDLNEPGAWTSGHTAEDSRLVADAAETPGPGPDEAAVGS